MPHTYRVPDWDSYRMDVHNPHRELEPLEQEIEVVDGALTALCDAGVLASISYDHDKFLALRCGVRDSFDIPWTAITPRVQRLLYAINAIHRPQIMVAAGIFCGNTFICNAGAAVGPGACYTATQLIGIEIKPAEAERAWRNVCSYAGCDNVSIVPDDAVAVIAELTEPIDLLYLDADGAGGRGKGVYLDILEAAYERIPAGGLVLAHNSVNSAERLADYLAFVRNESRFRTSINVILDGEGLEVSCR